MATSVNYVPPRDGDFNTWLIAFSAYITANAVALGLTSGDATTLAGMTTTWTDAYNAAIAGTTRGPMAVSTKDTARANVQAFARQLAIQVQANPAVTNDQKVALGITVRKTTKTPVPAPTTSPILTFIAATPLQHTLRFADQLTPASRALPFGAIALELSVYISLTPPIDSSVPSQMLTLTRNPAPVNFQTADRGKTAYYTGNWRTRTGLLGPVSAQLSAVIV